MDEGEDKLADVHIALYEVDGEGNIADDIAIDGDGIQAVVDTAEGGYYSFRLYPNRHYVVSAAYQGAEPLKPSPFTHNNYAH